MSLSNYRLPKQRIRCSNLFDLNGKKNKAKKLFLYVAHLIASGNEMLSKNAMSVTNNRLTSFNTKLPSIKVKILPPI